MRRPRAPTGPLLVAVAAVAATLAAAGCGGDKQDADEPTGAYRVDIVNASFPKEQRLAERTFLRVRVKNTGDEEIPNVAVTVDGLDNQEAVPGAADPSRPLWIVNRAPAGGETAYVNTWSLGRLPAGRARTFVWNLTAVVPGTHTLRYRVAAGLNGKARAVTADDKVPEGTLTARVTRRPRNTTVDPETGEVVVAQ